MKGYREFKNNYGEASLKRLFEIEGPVSHDVFVSRLYSELDKIISDLEAGRKERMKDGEDRLSLEIVTCLRAAGYHAVKDPTQGGHVDVLVSPKNKREYKWYGEAKIWHGIKSNIEPGLGQLLERYASGRDSHLGVLVYFQTAGACTHLKEWQEHLCTVRPLGAIGVTDIGPFVFDSDHDHASGARIKVRHFAVNVHWNPS